MRIGALVALVALYGVSIPSAATVYEFSEDGEQVVVGGPIESQQPESREKTFSRLSDEQLQILALTEQVALQFSGAPGVRKAGITAVEFTRLFSALIEQESFFEPTAVSSVGAIGLGQLMPETAADLGITDPLDPLQNLTGSARYLTAHLDRFGSVELALAAYNAGPGKVRSFGGVPPFTETYEFIQRITQAAGLTQLAPSETESDESQTENRKTSVWEFDDQNRAQSSSP